MPLIQSGSKEAVGENIKMEEEAGRPRAQSIAIAMDTQRRNGGGKVGVRKSDRKVGVRKKDRDGEHAKK